VHYGIDRFGAQQRLDLACIRNVTFDKLGLPGYRLAVSSTEIVVHHYLISCGDQVRGNYAADVSGATCYKYSQLRAPTLTYAIFLSVSTLLPMASTCDGLRNPLPGYRTRLRDFGCTRGNRSEIFLKVASACPVTWSML